MNSKTVNVVSISDGKDSTALALLAYERSASDLKFVFADTGHEHPLTYEYVDYLDGVLRDLCGVGVQRVKADFADRFAKKRETVQTKWRDEGVPEDRIERALAILHPTGIPLLDLCLLKGRFPSTRVRFCSQELKHLPITEQVFLPLMSDYRAIISWQGVRRQESPARAKLAERDIDLGEWEPEPKGVLIYRPLLDWTADDVFAMHRRHGVRWNPLYEQGMGLVGCMPCIHAGKRELGEIFRRFPEEVERVAEWERLVADASRLGAATFFAADKDPTNKETDINKISAETHGIMRLAEWTMTSRGGRQFDIFNCVASKDVPMCSSIYGLCE